MKDDDLRGIRVLIVDDSIDAAESMAFLLEGLGADTLVEIDGPSAIDAAATWAPHVVLLDLGMPGMDGYEVAKSMRAKPALHSVALIALTGRGRDSDMERSAATGFAHHVMKPANIEELKASIVMAVGRSS
ncbi:response regulator [Roseateles sp. L2-2]|uniref:response regulator n=1 Tax=Roseateles sp. L2-2 TaxID=3422597 RepID=UPI003D35F476